MERRRRGRPLRILLWSGAAVAAVALVVTVPRVGRLQLGLGRAQPLAVQVEGGVMDPSGVIAPSASTPTPILRFGDGTSVKLRPGARGRLASVDDRGARFSIERGTADVDVTPRPNARWQFDAGPFVITVHGTTFSAGWDEMEGRLDLRLAKGLVTVTGPVAGGPIQVRGGQHLTVTLRQARVLLRALEQVEQNDAQPGAGAGAAGATVAAALPEASPQERPEDGPLAGTGHASGAPGPGERPPAPRAPAVRVPSAHAGAGRAAAVDWVAALAAGDFGTIIRDADHEGSRALAARDSDELAALADAARYSRRDELARGALLAQRRRFPRSERARDAAFLLGRLDEAGGDGLAGAVKWYDRYLEEAPSGAYASEALGRKMVAVQKLHGTVRARAVAEEYARRFPSGTYLGAARALRDAR